LERVIHANIDRLRTVIARVSPGCARLQVIRFPVLFECGGDYSIDSRACVPLVGTAVNMIVLGRDLIVPEPHFAPFRQYIRTVATAAGQRVFFVNADYYGRGGGGLHCATLVRRSPEMLVNPAIAGR
jgi:hypothetical protein